MEQDESASASAPRLDLHDTLLLFISMIPLLLIISKGLIPPCHHLDLDDTLLLFISMIPLLLFISKWLIHPCHHLHGSDDHEPEICLALTVISDAKYAEELQFQEAIMASSALSSQTMNNTASCSSSTLTTHAPQAVPTSAAHEVVDLGADVSTQTVCGICVEVKDNDQMFSNGSCAHSFCSDCITKHVAAKLDESIQTVSCPGLDCKAVLTPEVCIPILPKLVLERWNEALCEALVLGCKKLYCPFSDCSMLLVTDDEGEGVTESECPACHRIFCAGCGVPWHPGVDCEEFQRLTEDERAREDLLVLELAKENKWMKCPKCKFLVEKTQGCVHITCRCQFQFCYGCGAEWTTDHGGCQSQCDRS